MTNWLSGSSRRFVWRLGRYLYRRARGESNNDMASNGEAYVQQCVLRGAADDDEPLTILDIGANVGAWTRFLLEKLDQRLLDSARIYAFEPVPETYARLQENVAGMKNGRLVRVMQIAFSDEPGEARMAVMHQLGGTNSLEFDERMAAAAREIVSVRKTVLSNFCSEEGIEHVHLAKVDTEGHDANVLKGALDLLRAGRIDVIQFEYNHRWVYARSFLKDVFDLIDGLPYDIARIRSSQLEVFEFWHPEMERFFEANYVIVRKPALEWFSVRHGKFDDSNTYA